MVSLFSFDIHTARIWEAIWFESYFHTSTLRKIRKITQWLFAAVLVLFLVVFLPGEQVVSERALKFLLATVFFTFAYGSAIFLIERFGETLKQVKPSPTEENLAEFLAFQAARTVAHAIKFAESKKLVELNSSVLLHFLLKGNHSLEFIFQRALLDSAGFKESLKKLLSLQPGQAKHIPEYSQDFQNTILKALDVARQTNREIIEIEDLFAALAIHNLTFNKFLIENNLSPEKDMANIAQWHWSLRYQIEEQKKFWHKKNLRKHGTMGREWAAGYTISLDRFSYDISKSATAMGFPKAIGHEHEKEAIEQILSRQDVNNNVLLVGNPGAGRKRLIQDFASRSALGESKSNLLNYKRVVELDLSYLLASIQNFEEAEAVLNETFLEAIQAGNIILVLDEFHNFVGEGLEAAAGRINITGILASCLRNPDFPLIAVTTYAGLHRYIEQNPSLLAFFEKVEVTELSGDESLAVLQEIVPSLERLYKRFISYPALKSIVAFADKYIQAVPFPKKALDLLDEAMGYLAQTKDPVLLPRHVAVVFSQRTQIPVGEIESAEKEVLLDLENLIHKRIINQDEAVKEVASALRRARTEISARGGPMGSFLFMGPTGVGKTETAKALAAIYFGSEARMVRLDMSEFQKVEDIDRLLGSLAQEGILTTAIREDPFSLLLLDELEKAHPNILNLFLQVLDEGHITDGLGRKVDFRHTIIIATSNAGYQLILQAIKEGADFSTLKERMLDYLFQEGIYRPEFLNRFDAVVIFKPLSKENLLDIAGLMLDKLQTNLKEKGIEFIVEEPLKEKIAQLGYDPTFGARNMRRVLQNKVENPLAIALLSNKIKRNDRITIDSETFEVRKL